MPTRIPPDRPCGDKQNQWKSFPAARLCKNGIEKLDLPPFSNKAIKSKGSFGSHHLGLESKKLFMILTITCLAATELAMEFIWNSMGFHLMPNLNIYWVPCHFCGFFKMK
jgi:hypothetical protein